MDNYIGVGPGRKCTYSINGRKKMTNLAPPVQGEGCQKKVSLSFSKSHVISIVMKKHIVLFLRHLVLASFFAFFWVKQIYSKALA